MKTSLPFRLTLNYLSLVIIYMLFSIGLQAQTYTTIANGAWSSSSTWQGGSIPDATNIPLTAVINIKHSVTYSGPNIVNAGTINIYNPVGISPQLLVAGGINLTNNLGGKIYITGGEYRQYRFAGGGQSGVSQNGTFTNNGGYVQIKSSYVEVAQNWNNSNIGVVVFRNSSLVIGQSYQTNNASVDTLLNTSVSIGWQGSGSFTEGGTSAYFQSFRVELAGASGDFTLNDFLIANGEIDYITLKNDFTGIAGSGKIEAKPNLVTSGITLQAYCNQGNYLPRAKFIGAQTQNCSLNYFPSMLIGASPPARMNFSSNPVLIAGTDRQVGAKYIYQSVAPGMDAIVNIDSIVGGASINMLDDNSGGVGFMEAFQPQITSGPTVGNSYAVFTFNYKITGTSVDYKMDSINLTAIDIDGNSGLKEFDQISAGPGAVANYVAGNPSISLTQVSPGTFKGINVDGIERTGVDTLALQNMFTVKNINVSSFRATMGISTTQAQLTTRQFSLYTKGFNYPTLLLLPVKMESFTATLSSNDKNVNLLWTTASEINVSHFVIEKSTDGQNFSDAGVMFAYGNATDNTDYSYSDDVSNVQSAVIYYRLRSVDIDGKSQYSEVRIIRLGKQTENSITLLTYPNPASNEVRITVPNNWQNKKVVYEMFTAGGQSVKRTETANSSQTETLNISTLAPGFYIIKTTCEGQTARQKIVKQ